MNAEISVAYTALDLLKKARDAVDHMQLDEAGRLLRDAEGVSAVARWQSIQKMSVDDVRVRRLLEKTQEQLYSCLYASQDVNVTLRELQQTIHASLANGIAASPERFIALLPDLQAEEEQYTVGTPDRKRLSKAMEAIAFLRALYNGTDIATAGSGLYLFPRRRDEEEGIDFQDEEQSLQTHRDSFEDHAMLRRIDAILRGMEYLKNNNLMGTMSEADQKSIVSWMYINLHRLSQRELVDLHWIGQLQKKLGNLSQE